VDSFVVQLQCFGEPFERHAHVKSHLLRVNAPGRFVVQLGQDYLQASAAMKEGLELLLESHDLAFQLGGSLPKVRFIGFDYCGRHG
jgi:predicted RNase H-like HicB family nuclease